MEMRGNGVTRALATLLGAAVAGVLLWLAAQIGRSTTGGYWAAYVVVASAGFAFAISQLRGRRTGFVPMLALALVPVLVVVGWVVVAGQPTANDTRGHVLNWSGDMGIADVVSAVGKWLGVLAFGFGYTVAATLEPLALSRRRQEAVPVVEPAAADAPTTAERREVAEPRVPRREAVPR